MTEKSATFLCQYEHDGKAWGFEIKPSSFEDAEARMKSIATSGRVDGELVAVVPVDPAVEYEEGRLH